MTDKTIKFSGKGLPGDLLDPNNWIGDVVPGINNTALITTNIGGPAGGVFSVNNLMLLGSETITFTGTLDTAGVGACQGLMVCDNAEAIFAPGAVLNDGNVMIVGNEAVGSLVALGTGSTHSVLNTVTTNIGKQDDGVGTVTINDADWTNSGRALVGDDGSGTLNVINNSAVKIGGDVNVAACAGSTGKVSIASGGAMTVGGNLTIGGAPTSGPAGSVTVGATGGLTVDQTLSVGSASVLVMAGGTVTADTAVVLRKALAGSVISGFGTLNAPAVQDGGIILATGGKLQISGNLTGTGSVEIAANSTASLTGATLKLAGIGFLGSDGTLALAHGASVTAPIAGFAIGDIIAMASINAVSFNAATGVLTLSENSAQVTALHLTGSFTGDTFAIQQTAGAALISLQHS